MFTIVYRFSSSSLVNELQCLYNRFNQVHCFDPLTSLSCGALHEFKVIQKVSHSFLIFLLVAIL